MFEGGGGGGIFPIIYLLIESKLGLNLQVCEAPDKDVGREEERVGEEEERVDRKAAGQRDREVERGELGSEGEC